MRPSADEITSARELAEAFLGFVVAVEQGMTVRRLGRARDRAAATDRIQATLDRPTRSDQPQVEAKRMPPERILLTTRETARLLSISDRKLWEITAPRGPIPVVRLGRSVRYSVDELSAAIRRQTIAPETDC